MEENQKENKERNFGVKSKERLQNSIADLEKLLEKKTSSIRKEIEDRKLKLKKADEDIEKAQNLKERKLNNSKKSQVGALALNVGYMNFVLPENQKNSKGTNLDVDLIYGILIYGLEQFRLFHDTEEKIQKIRVKGQEYSKKRSREITEKRVGKLNQTTVGTEIPTRNVVGMSVEQETE